MSLTVRLVAYAPNGAKLGLLPDPLQASATFTHNDVGALTLTYSSLSTGGPWVSQALESGLEIAVEVNWGTSWVEPYGGRFLLLDRDNDPTRPDKAVTLTCPSYGWMLRKAGNYKLTGLEPAKSKFAGQRKFTKRSAGYIMWELLQEHFDRVGLGITLHRGWASNAVTSDGVAWTRNKTLYYPPGVDLWTVLDGLQASDLCDWRTDQRLLRMWNPDSQWTDRSTTVRLDYGRELADAPSRESLSELVARVLVRGEKSNRKTYTSGTAPTPWGIWEGYAEAGGVEDTEDLDTIGDRALAEGARLRGEYTRELTLQGESLPFRDWQPGDWVKAPAVMAYQRMRVQAVTLSLNSGVWGGNIVLHDRVMAAELRRAKVLAAVNLTTQPPSGSGLQPTMDDQQDFRTPAAPTGLSLTSSLYVDGWGITHATLDASWTAVTAATDGTPITLAGYELWGQPSGEAWRRITATPINSVSWKPFQPGSTWFFRVRPIGDTTTVPGQDSAAISHTFPVDTTPPGAPSAPSVTAWLGTLAIAWNGLTALGAAMPADFGGVRVHVSTTNGFTPAAANEVGLITSIRGGAVTLSDLTYGIPHYVRLVAIDKSGNASTASAQATATPTQIVDVDIEDDAIPSAKIANLYVNKLLGATLQAGAWITAGNPASYFSRMDSSGFSVWREDPEGGPSILGGRLGTGSADFLQLTGADGDVQASIDEQGRGIFTGLNIPEKRDGYELNVYGKEFTEWLGYGARGIVDRARITSTSPATSAEAVVMEIRSILRPDREYAVNVWPHHVDCSAATSIRLRLRIAYDGASVGVGSTMLSDHVKVMPNTIGDTAAGVTASISTAGQVQPEREVRIAYTISSAFADSVWVEANQWHPCVIEIEDKGPAIVEASAVARRVSEWECTSSEAYALISGSGVARTDATYLGYANSPLTVGPCHGGVQDFSLALFNGTAVVGETTLTIPGALSGATVEKVEAYLFCQWSSQSSVQLDVRTSTLTSITNTQPSGTALSATIAEGSGKWVNITSLWSGSSRSLWLGPTGTGTSRHGHIRSQVAPSGRPRIRITYRR